MLKIIQGNYKGYPFLFQYETGTELKLLILKFQNVVDFVFCDQEIFEDNEKLILDEELCHWGCAWEEINKLEVDNE